MIGEIIYRKTYLKQIYLHWNQIGYKGGEMIFN